MQTLLRGIARKAKQNKDYKFGNIYGLFNKDALYQAWRDINKKSATGIDKETAREFVKNLDGNLEELVEELKGKRYKAKV
jgi:RNA-directed DNA polymerase